MPPQRASLPVNLRTRPSDGSLLPLFFEQLSWLLKSAQETKRVFTAWLLASPPPPSGPAALLAQGRRLTARHLVQLEQLLEGLALPPRTDGGAIDTLLQQGETCLRSDQSDARRYEEFLATLHRLSSCYAATCASAGETAVVLGRLDIAAVLASWAAAWRELQRLLRPIDPAGLTARPPATAAPSAA